MVAKDSWGSIDHPLHYRRHDRDHRNLQKTVDIVIEQTEIFVDMTQERYDKD